MIRWPRELTRRSFVQWLGGATVAAGLPDAFAGCTRFAAAAEEAAGPHKDNERRYRAVSWWLTWDDLSWPNEALIDKIRRRADRCAGSGVNCCILFGAHYRWDFLPLWGRLHDLFRFIAEELHQRQIVLFDHHSSVLTHRPRSREEALEIWHHNRHAIPFYPSREVAATWQFNGSRLNDWRMIDVETGQPVFVSGYTAEQYCMNHPAFQDAYSQYVKRLWAEAGVDGLMSDDGIFYAGWHACGCPYCRERFRKEYGHSLPPVADASFWGNRGNQAFCDWIDLRFRSCGDHLLRVRQALPQGFPLLSCCSSSDAAIMPAMGMSYQDFIHACNLIMLEMCGSTPSAAGTWDDRIPSQLLHLGIGRDHHAVCLGLGYGFFPDTAFFVWALNKFLGADCWFSTLKGRLGGSPAQFDALPDDSELVGEGYRWEKAHPQLFRGEVDTNVAVFFSRATRDYYGQCSEDYVNDYYTSCLQLMRAGISFDVVTDVPQTGRWRHLVLSSAACLSADTRRRLRQFMENGGTVIATGPTGHYDQRARPVAWTWLHEFGSAVELVEPSRPGGFPPGQMRGRPVAIAHYRVPETLQKQLRDGWLVVPVGRGQLLWRPERFDRSVVAAAVVTVLDKRPSDASIAIQGLPAGWRVRQFRHGSRRLIHAIPAQVGTVLHLTLQNAFSRERVIEKLRFAPLSKQLALESAVTFSRLLLHSPDLAEPRVGRNLGGENAAKAWVVDPSGVSRYFILECFA